MIHACWASQIILTALGIPCVVFVQFTKWITFKFPRASVYKKPAGYIGWTPSVNPQISWIAMLCWWFL